jgi:hypothetical protein
MIGCVPEGPALLPILIRFMVRNLVCIDLISGRPFFWQNNVKASSPEDGYCQSDVSSHSYTSNSRSLMEPASMPFSGRGGVDAFNVDAFNITGSEIWHADAGKESGSSK